MALNFFNKRTTAKGLISESDQLRITNAIAKAEMTTSGEIRVYMELKCPQITALDRATEIFYTLQMEKTSRRNGVIIYLALEDRKAAIFGDEGIYIKTGGASYWEEEFNTLIHYLKNDNLVEGLETVISDIGFSLSTHFPYVSDEDKNELPDEIVFGNH